MPEQWRPTLPGVRVAGAFLLLSLTAVTALVPVFYLGMAPALVVPMTYAIPFLLIPCVALSAALVWAGRGEAPPAGVAAGVAYFVGGALFDIAATLIHSPDLEYEGNPVARALLDSGHSLPFIYAYAAVCQSLTLLTLCLLWVAFLRHRPALVGSVKRRGSPVRPFLTYHLFWLVVALVLAGAADRWYLGLEWFGLVPHAGWAAVAAANVLGLSVYLAWLWHATRPAPGG